MGSQVSQPRCDAISPKSKLCRQAQEYSSSDWGCAADVDSPVCAKHVLASVFVRVDFKSLLQCELVSRSWHALLCHPETASAWCNNLSLASSFDFLFNRRLKVDPEGSASLIVTDIKAFFQWLPLRLPGVSCLRLELHVAKGLLPEVLFVLTEASLPLPAVTLWSGRPAV